jgi:hypothetical protein
LGVAHAGRLTADVLVVVQLVGGAGGVHAIANLLRVAVSLGGVANSGAIEQQISRAISSGSRAILRDIARPLRGVAHD